ncbi:hypothetical protein HPB51_009038 [Rhipicephalus microplus]|uniref:Uncharacterized protein n=1 Tax=Rhipicephalus microplus TaxID=6941 RepID=A0A9J6D973_RHIMP|nr:hypothetical protein HPB51_009038 [Rhipicephalus microplus]
MAATAAKLDLVPNRNLLDAKFDSYRLTLEPLPIIRLAFQGGVQKVHLEDDQYGYLHVQMAGFINALVQDPWDVNTLFFISEARHVMWAHFSQASGSDKPSFNYQELDDCDDTMEYFTFTRLCGDSHRATHQTASADFSFAALCNAVRHVYLYRQPETLGSSQELRNRKTGREVSSIAKLHVISLEQCDSIRGMVASRRCIFVLSPGALYAIKVPS